MMASTSSGIEWDPSAQRLYGLARQVCFAIGDEYMGTQHLLLAAVAVTPIDDHGFETLSYDRVLSAVVAMIGIRDPRDVLLSPGGQTPRAKLVIQRAGSRAAAASRAVCCRDIWYGLLAD